MSLIEHDLYLGKIDKVQNSIDLLRQFEPPDGYYLAYSGGKDSDCILELAKISGVKFDAHYNLTTVDPPELVWHVKTHPEVKVVRPKETMWQLIKRMRTPPTMLMRYCCRILKEQGGNGRWVMTGIRKQESSKRAKRHEVEDCYKKKEERHYIHPIMYWTHDDVWEFIRTRNIPYCKLYDEGFKRLGCVMCPFGNRKRDMEKFPRIAEAWHRAIIRYFNLQTTQRGKCHTGEEFWQWWLSGKGKKEEGGLFT